jgi:hypothetical protein
MTSPTPIQLSAAEGRVPVSFEMDEHEVISLHRPLPMYVLAHRHSYLPLVSLQAVHSFQDSAPQVGAEGVWYATPSGHPLRWDMPIGVLYDAHGDGQLPWRVLVRFQEFPSAVLLRAGLKETERAYFHSLKQALNLLSGSARSFMDLRQHDQEALWQAVESGRFADSWRIVQSLLPPDQGLQLAPVRVVSLRTHEVRQAPVRLDDHATTLQQALALLTAGRPCSNVTIQGIRPPLDSSLRSLCRELCSHDLFLYICCEF